MFAGEPVQSQGVEGERAGAAKADRGFEGFSLKSLFNNFKGFQWPSFYTATFLTRQI